jgi:hypothetical protein
MSKQQNHPFVGTWHITEMDMWDEDYFNMEVQAFITIRADDSGEFQFGLVAASLYGGPEGDDGFSFTWEGSDEMEEASGSGWLELINRNELEGMFEFHNGDESGFKAKRVKELLP